ncbi:MAG: hypothetical protein WD045_07075 [Pirellulaceae bacterium]
MQSDPATSLIRQFHRSGTKSVAVVTGGGSEALSQILSVPGASESVLEALIPYSAAALSDFLRYRPTHYCSEATARAIAMRAFLRARELSTRGDSDCATPTDSLLGIGCTASLRSWRPKRGEHRVHVAAQTASGTSVSSLILRKDARERDDEEHLVAAMILNRIAESAGLDARLPLDLLPGERIEQQYAEAVGRSAELIAGTRSVCLGSPGPEDDLHDPPQKALEAFPGILIPGAFNPLHHGHLELAEVATQILGRQPDFEISIENVDKPPLDYFEIARRATQFGSYRRLWLTRAPTFVEKSRIFPECCFVVGADTIVRIGNPKYYFNSVEVRDVALRELREQNCRFLVFPRLVKGAFLTLSDLSLPPALAEICEEVPPSIFRIDLSSSEIRRESITPQV